MLKKTFERFVAKMSCGKPDNFSYRIRVLFLCEYVFAELTRAGRACARYNSITFYSVVMRKPAVEGQVYIFGLVSVADLIHKILASFIDRIAMGIVIFAICNDVEVFISAKAMNAPNVAVMAFYNRKYSIYFDILFMIPFPYNCPVLQRMDFSLASADNVRLTFSVSVMPVPLR